MNFELIFLKRARKDLANAIECYEEKQNGLGLRFLQAVYAHVDKIMLNPNIFSEKRRFYKEAKISSFPYVIVYKVHRSKKSTTIVTIFHTSRSTRLKYKE